MTTTRITPAPAPATPRRRGVTVTLWTAQILLAAGFAAMAASKLLGDPGQVAGFQAIGFGQWFRYLTGACELGGAIGLLIPRLSGLAAYGLVGVMIGATLTNLFLLPGMAPVAIMTVVLGAVFATIGWARRQEVRALLSAFGR